MNPEIDICTATGLNFARVFPLSSLPEHAVGGNLIESSPESPYFAAVGAYWQNHATFPVEVRAWCKAIDLRPPTTLSVQSRTPIDLAGGTSEDLWSLQSTEENANDPCGFVFARTNPTADGAIHLACRGMDRLLNQMRLRAKSTTMPPKVPIPTVAELKPYTHPQFSLPLPKLYTLPEADAATSQPRVNEGDFEAHGDSGWLSTNAIFDGTPSKADVGKLLAAVTHLNNHKTLATWWHGHTHYPSLTLIFHITTGISGSSGSSQWYETYRDVGYRDDDYEPTQVWKPTPVLEINLPEWGDFNTQLWQQHLQDALQAVATTLNLPTPPDVWSTTKTTTPTKAIERSCRQDSTTTDITNFDFDPNSSHHYALRANGDTTTIFTEVNTTLFAIDIPTNIANHPCDIRKIHSALTLCDTSSAFGYPDDETVFQVAVAHKDGPAGQGLGTGFEIRDWWEDDGFYIEEHPEGSDFTMRHVNDDGNHGEGRALRRMTTASGHIFVTMWTYPATTPAAKQHLYDQSLTTMRVTQRHRPAS